MLNLLIERTGSGLVQGLCRRQTAGQVASQALLDDGPQQYGIDKGRSDGLVRFQAAIGIVHGCEQHGFPDLALLPFEGLLGFREQEAEQVELLQLLIGGAGMAAEE